MTAYPWLKLWNEAPTDPKWLAVADMAGCSPSLVWHTFSAALAYANEQPKRGSIAGFDPRVIASFCRVAVKDVIRVLQALHEFGLLLGERIGKWAKRQGKLPCVRTANAERIARCRAKKATAQGTLNLDLPALPPPISPPIPTISSESEAFHSTISSAEEEEGDVVSHENQTQNLSSPSEPVSARAREAENEGKEMKEAEKGEVESSKRSAPLAEPRFNDSIPPETIEAISSIFRGEPHTPSLKARIKNQLQQKLSRFLAATGGDVMGFWESQCSDDPAVAQHAFDQVDRLMRLADWDDMREHRAEANWKRI